MYWSDRQKQLYTQLEKDEKELTQRLTSYYRLEFGKLDKEIAAFYQKYGVNNIIEYRTVMEALPDNDRKLLIEQMEEFAKKYPEHAHLIPVRKNIYKLNRLEGLQQSVIMHQLNMGAVTKETLEKHLNKQALRAVNAAAEAMGFGRSFYIVSDDIVKRFVGVPWCNGKDFSERIWDNTNKLAYYLTTDISQGFARGDSYQKLTQQLKVRFTSVSTKDVYRLVYTEGTYVMAEGSMQPFTEDFEKYRISTAADGKVCSICSALARKEFYIKDRAAGVNFPPFHPWCRCTFEIVVDDWDEWIENYVNKHSADKPQAEKVLNNVCKSDKITLGFNSNTNYNYPITNASIKNVTNLKIVGLSNEQNNVICEQRKRLLLYMKNYETGTEGSVSIDLINLISTEIKLGDFHNTKIIDLDMPYFAIHNHPDNGVLSPGDIIGFCKRVNMYGLESIGNDGVHNFVILKTLESNPTEYIKYIDDELKIFSGLYPNLDSVRDYDIINRFSMKLLKDGEKYGFKIIRSE